MHQREDGKMKTFADKAYDLLRKVPRGRVTTYKEIAHALGTRAYRGIGQAMRRNGTAIQKKIKMLKDEGIEFDGGKVRNFEQVLFRFS